MVDLYNYLTSDPTQKNDAKVLKVAINQRTVRGWHWSLVSLQLISAIVEEL